MKTASHEEIGQALSDANYYEHQFKSFTAVEGAGDTGLDYYLEQVSDITAGAVLCIEMASKSHEVRQAIIDGINVKEVPVLSLLDTYVATRFAIAALRKLGNDAADRLHHRNRRAVGGTGRE